MAFSKETREHMEACLMAVVPIESRAMFGGVAFYAEGRVFAILAEDKLWLRADDATKRMFMEADMGPFFPYDSPTPMPYWQLPDGVLEQPDELRPWVDAAIGAAERAAAKRKPRTPRARKK